MKKNISKELSEQLPFLATTQILMACVKAGIGREVAHEMIKKHATTNTTSNFFTALISEKDFPLSLAQLNDLIKSPAEFAGSALEQSTDVVERIKNVTKGEVSKVDLAELI